MTVDVGPLGVSGCVVDVDHRHLDGVLLHSVARERERGGTGRERSCERTVRKLVENVKYFLK